ncbi:small nuclear ribonucleoprotein-associated protein B'-like, partial [Xiphias gladius]|uniref:small nuclear ribonucleoprotein-associated protein B'-like n=1 Tax=Xiphias gladius TaxID=8245 RepID=UPI001A99C066
MEGEGEDAGSLTRAREAVAGQPEMEPGGGRAGARAEGEDAGSLTRAREAVAGQPEMEPGGGRWRAGAGARDEGGAAGSLPGPGMPWPGSRRWSPGALEGVRGDLRASPAERLRRDRDAWPAPAARDDGARHKAAGSPSRLRPGRAPEQPTLSAAAGSASTVFKPAPIQESRTRFFSNHTPGLSLRRGAPPLPNPSARSRRWVGRSLAGGSPPPPLPPPPKAREGYLVDPA